MKKVKMRESARSIPPVSVEPMLMLKLYLGGINDFGFVSNVISKMAQLPSGVIFNETIQKIKITFVKKGSVVNLVSIDNAPVKKETIKSLLGCLGKVLSKDKTAVDISTAA